LNKRKLLRDEKAKASIHDDPGLKEIAGGAGLSLPMDKSALDVVTDYLTQLSRYCMGHPEKKMTLQVLKVTSIKLSKRRR
jgi:hypothetical protein